MNKTNSFPKLEKNQQSGRLALKTDWDQITNSSIPLTIRAQMTTKRNKTDLLGKNYLVESDVSYLKTFTRKFQSIESSIYKDPELTQTKYDKSMQSFYSTMYKKSQTKMAFNTNIERQQRQISLDFGDLMKDSPNNTLSKYFFDILKHEIKQQSSSHNIPPNRQQVIDLKDWLFIMIQQTQNECKNLTSVEVADKIQIIYSLCLKELINQIKIECLERGELLQIVWDFYIQLIEQILKSSTQQLECQDQAIKFKLQEQEQFYENQIQQQFRQYKEQQEKNSILEFDYKRALELNLEQKEQILNLTTEYREALETISLHRKNIDELQLQLITLRTEMEGGEQEENKKINIQIQQGQSIVSHLMNFQAKIDQEQKYALKSPTKYITQNSQRTGKKNSIIFDKWEQLRLQESQLKSQIFSLNHIDMDYPSQSKTHQIIQEDKEIQTDCLQNNQQIYNNNNDTKQLNIQELQQQDQKNEALTQSLLDAIKLIEESQLQPQHRLLLCRTLSESKDAVAQNQTLSQRIIQLNKEDNLKKLELLDKEEQCDEIQFKLQTAVQDFISILKKEKQKIQKLKTQNSQLVGTLKDIESKYEIVINEIKAIDEEERDTYNNLDFDGVDGNIRLDNSNFQDSQHEDQLDLKQNEEERKVSIQMVESIRIAKQQQKDNNNATKNSLIQNEQLDDKEQNNQQIKRQSDQLDSFESNGIQHYQYMRNSQQYEINSKEDIISNRKSEVIRSKNSIRSNNSRQSSQLFIQDSDGQMLKSSSNKSQYKKQQSSRQLINSNNTNTSQRLSQNQVINTQQTSNNSIQQQEQFHVRKKQTNEKAYINKRASKNNTQNSPIEERNENSPLLQMSQINLADGSLEDERNKRVRDMIAQYKDSTPMNKYEKIHKNLHFNLLQETKQPKKFRRIYSQNTDVANNLLRQIQNQKKKQKTISLLQFNKIINQILTDISKQSEGYKVPFHVCIYDFIKNKYGFKQVAERKIKQIYEFIFIEKDINLRVNLISKYCSLRDEVDEIAQKLLIETFIIFNPKIEIIKGEQLLNYDSVSEFLNDKAKIWLLQNQIQQLQIQYKQQSQQHQNKHFINYDQLLLKILDFYIYNKQDQQKILEVLFKAADLDGNQLIEYQEFKTLFRAIHSEKQIEESLLQLFIKNADFVDELGDRYLTLPRFTEMSLELSIFQKESVIKYGEGNQQLKEKWFNEKDNIKLRFLQAKQYSKVRHTFEKLESQITNSKLEKQEIFWISYKLLNEQSLRVYLKYQTQQCLQDLLPPSILMIRTQYKQMDQLD